MDYSFADYEAGVLAALEGLLAPAGPLLVLEGYAGQIRATEFGVEVNLRGLPAALVEIEGADYEVSAHPYLTAEVRVVVYVAARSWREQAEARSGEAGAYALLQAIRQALTGNTLGLEVRSCGLLPVEERLIAGDQAQVIYAARYRLWNDRVPAA